MRHSSNLPSEQQSCPVDPGTPLAQLNADIRDIHAGLLKTTDEKLEPFYYHLEGFPGSVAAQLEQFDIAEESVRYDMAKSLVLTGMSHMGEHISKCKLSPENEFQIACLVAEREVASLCLHIGHFQTFTDDQYEKLFSLMAQNDARALLEHSEYYYANISHTEPLNLALTVAAYNYPVVEEILRKSDEMLTREELTAAFEIAINEGCITNAEHLAEQLHDLSASTEQESKLLTQMRQSQLELSEGLAYALLHCPYTGHSRDAFYRVAKRLAQEDVQKLYDISKEMDEGLFRCVLEHISLFTAGNRLSESGSSALALLVESNFRYLSHESFAELLRHANDGTTKASKLMTQWQTIRDKLTFGQKLTHAERALPFYTDATYALYQPTGMTPFEVEKTLLFLERLSTPTSPYEGYHHQFQSHPTILLHGTKDTHTYFGPAAIDSYSCYEYQNWQDRGKAQLLLTDTENHRCIGSIMYTPEPQIDLCTDCTSITQEDSFLKELYEVLTQQEQTD